MNLVSFVIPVRHQANAADWPGLKARLKQTAASVAAQSRGDWRGVIVANEGADLPALPAQFHVERVDFPPNPIYDLHSAEREAVYDAVRLDKGRRVLAGMLSVPDARYLMVVDDDDFVSASIVDFVSRHDGAPGWTITRGFRWSEGSSLVLREDNFSGVCGTSHIVRTDLYRLPASFAGADEDYIRKMLGSHRFIEDALAAEGMPLADLPFRGAIYRNGHAGQHSKSGNIVSNYLLRRSVLRHPRTLIRNLARFRFIDGRLRQEFFAGQALAV